MLDKCAQMNEVELRGLLTGNFYQNFAATVCEAVVSGDAVDALYRLATNVDTSLPKMLRDKLSFRSAYALETLFFVHCQLFTPYAEQFCDDFSRCTNNSAKRHFAKIMAHLLQEYEPSRQQCEAIAESCVDWILDPKVRVAVKIGAVEVLRELHGTVEWVDDAMEDIMTMMRDSDLPSLRSRLRNDWCK